MLSQPRILVGTDFSKHSDQALMAADYIRQKTQGELHVVHVTQFPTEWSWMGNDALVGYLPANFSELYSSELKKALTEQLKRLKIEASAEVIFGNPGPVLRDLTKKKTYNLMVLGRLGESEDKLLGGSVAAKLASSSHIPTLFISTDFAPKKIAGLVDTQRPHPEIFQMGEEFSYLLSTELLYVSLWKDLSLEMTSRMPLAPALEMKFTPEQKSKIATSMEAILKRQADEHSKAKFKVGITEELSIAEALIQTVKEEGADLLIVLRHQKKLMEKIFMGSVTRRIYDSYHGNLLILPSYEP